MYKIHKGWNPQSECLQGWLLLLLSCLHDYYNGDNKKQPINGEQTLIHHRVKCLVIGCLPNIPHMYHNSDVDCKCNQSLCCRLPNFMRCSRTATVDYEPNYIPKKAKLSWYDCVVKLVVSWVVWGWRYGFMCDPLQLDQDLVPDCWNRNLYDWLIVTLCHGIR